MFDFEYKFLGCGVDTLEASCSVDWEDFYSSLSPLLNTCKFSAQSSKSAVFLPDYSEPVEVLSHGAKPYYKYGLKHSLFFVFLSDRENGTSQHPNVKVKFRSSAIWSLGLDCLLDKFRAFIGDFGGVIDEGSFKVSRCDLCADFWLSSPLTFDLLRVSEVSRSRKRNNYLNGDSLETYYVGAPSAPVQVRIYDKSKEITAHHKEWFFFDVWGTPFCDDVWRVEFQLRRDFLRDFGVSSYDDLKSKMGGLWEYLTTSAYSLRYPFSGRAANRPLLPWWASVSECASKFGEVFSLQRTKREPSSASYNYHIARASRSLLKYAVIFGLRDFDSARDRFLDEMSRYWQNDERDFISEYDSECVKSGKVFERVNFVDDIPF